MAQPDINAISSLIAEGQGESRELGVQDPNKREDLLINGDDDGGEGGEPELELEEGQEQEIEEDPGLPEESKEVEGEGGEDSAPINTITELAHELELDPTEIYNLAVPMRDGMEPVTISELKDAYHELKSGGGVNAAQHQQEVRELQTQLQQATQTFPQQNKKLQEIDQNLAALQQQYNNVDWPRFESEQPAEAVLQKQKFQEAYSSIMGQRQQTANELTQQQAYAQQQYKQGEWARARQTIEGWNEPETMQGDLRIIGESLMKYGFNMGEIREITDHRLLKFLRDSVVAKKAAETPLPKTVRKTRASAMRAGSLRTKKDTGKIRQGILEKGRATTDPHSKARAITELIELGGSQ